MDDSWQAAQARNRFTEIVDAAVEGRPQYIRRRDGREVVLVSKEYFEKTKPNLKTYLLSARYAGDQDDEFDAAMHGISSGSTQFLVPRDPDRQD